MSKEVVLGQLADESSKRDAIHIAVAPVIAGEMLIPGDEIGFMNPNVTDIVGRANNPTDLRRKAVSGIRAIGIVDPFLRDRVKQGERFWMLLFPRTITGLRHAWTHPAFKDEALGVVNEPGRANDLMRPEPAAQSVEDFYECCPDPDEEEECCP